MKLSNCMVCGQEVPKRWRKFCSLRCRQQYWNVRNQDKRRKLWRESNKRFRHQWGISTAKHHLDPEVVQSELFVAQYVLPQHGFTDILLCRQFSVYFPFDILAKKDDDLCGIFVTLAYSKQLDPRLLPLIDFLGLRLFTCHVKPDLQKYYLLEMPRGKKFSSCRGIFMEEVVKQ